MGRQSKYPEEFRRRAAALVPAIPYLWLGVFFLIPILIVLKISLSDAAIAQPPYRPVFEWSEWRAFLDAVSPGAWSVVCQFRRRSRAAADQAGRAALPSMPGRATASTRLGVRTQR